MVEITHKAVSSQNAKEGHGKASKDTAEKPMKNINHPNYDPHEIAIIMAEAYGNQPDEPGYRPAPKPKYSGDIDYEFEEVEYNGALYSGELVVDIITEFDYDHGTIWSDTRVKGINNLQMDSARSPGNYYDVDTTTPRGQALTKKLADKIIDDNEHFRERVEDYLTNLGPDE